MSRRARVSLSVLLAALVGLSATGCGSSASAGAASSGGGAGASSSSGGERASNTNNTSRGGAVVSSDPQLHAGPAQGFDRAGEGPAVAMRGSGMDAEHPVSACGPRDSYDFVASRFRCPDGTNPLGGDLSAGQASRLGNVGANSQGHIIDVYRVPCASGPVDVYVDMYGCPEMQQMLGL